MPEPGSEADEAVRDARAFHEAYERLAPSFGYETRKASAVPWDEVPEQNRALMIAVCAEVVGAIRASERAKWDAVKQGYVDAAATIEAEFRHYRERFEPIMEEAVASERAKVEALLEAVERLRVLYQRPVDQRLGVDELKHAREAVFEAADAVRAGRAS